MFTPFVKEVKLMGQGSLPGWNPSGSPAYMYQATVQPGPGAPGPQPASPPVSQPTVVPRATPVAPLVPSSTVVVSDTSSGLANAGLILVGLVGLAFVGAMLLPTGGRRR